MRPGLSNRRGQILPAGKCQKKREMRVKRRRTASRISALQFRPRTLRLTDWRSFTARKMSRIATRDVKARAEFPLPKFRHSPDAFARNQQRPTATRGWSKLTPVRPLGAPGACEQQQRARKTGRVSGVGSSRPIFVGGEGAQKMCWLLLNDPHPSLSHRPAPLRSRDATFVKDMTKTVTNLEARQTFVPIYGPE